MCCEISVMYSCVPENEMLKYVQEVDGFQKHNNFQEFCDLNIFTEHSVLRFPKCAQIYEFPKNLSNLYLHGSLKKLIELNKYFPKFPILRIPKNSSDLIITKCNDKPKIIDVMTRHLFVNMETSGFGFERVGRSVFHNNFEHQEDRTYILIDSHEQIKHLTLTDWRSVISSARGNTWAVTHEITGSKKSKMMNTITTAGQLCAKSAHELETYGASLWKTLSFILSKVSEMFI